jgi:hypothetical protein
MSPRMHLSLRIAALTLLVSAAIWPRTRGQLSAAELAPARAMASHAETAAATLVSAPGSAKLVVAAADQSDLTN